MEELALIESNISELSEVAARALAVLSDSEWIPDSVRYQRVIRCVSELRQLWADHLALEAQNPQLQELFIDMSANRSSLEFELNALVLAAWPRSPKAGLCCIHLRVCDVITTLQQQIDQERLLILSLMPAPKTTAACA